MSNSKQIHDTGFATILDERCTESQERKYDDLYRRLTSTLVFPGSWSDVSRGALFEMEIERVHHALSPQDQANKPPWTIEIDTELGIKLQDIPKEAEFAKRETRSQVELENGGEIATESELGQHASISLTQRPTSTRFIPIPNRKPHLIYKGLTKPP